MDRILSVVFLAAILTGCNKSDDKLVWQSTFGDGAALTVKCTGDTGFVAAGYSSDTPYLLYLGEDKARRMDFRSENSGLLSSVIPGSGFFLTGGSISGKMYLARIDMQGSARWDTIISGTYPIHHTSLCKLAGGNYLAAGTAHPDSSQTARSGLLFVIFSESGTILSSKELTFDMFVTATGIAADNQNNIYLALSKTGTAGKLKASVAKYNSLFQKIYEEELYNNQSFGAASLTVNLDPSNNPVITGRTGMAVSSGTETNAFIARYHFTGDSVSREYLEYSNTATAAIPDGTGEYYVLNSKCMIIDIVDQNISFSGIIRTFNSCDSETTDCFGYSLDLMPDGNLLIGGRKGSSFYLVIKSSSDLSPV